MTETKSEKKPELIRPLAHLRGEEPPAPDWFKKAIATPSEEGAVMVGTSNILPDTVDLTGSWTEGQGYGAGGRVVGCSYGWGGAAGTAAMVDFKRGLRAQLFTQYMPSEAYPIQGKFSELVEADLAAHYGV